MDYYNVGLRSYTIILFISTLSFIAGSNVNCNGKAFHCVNSTHFKICVDLGGGVSTTVDEFLISCPRNTVCKQYNLFECEYEVTTTPPPVTAPSEVTNEQFQTSVNSVREQFEITTIFPMKQQQGMELSEKYFNKVNATHANFTSNFLTDATASITIDPVISSETKNLNTISNSDINKTLNMPQSIDKELSFSTNESGIDTAPTLRYNVNILETDIGVRSNYLTDISTTQDKKTIDSVKSSKALNENSLDLDAMSTGTESSYQVSSVSELPYSETVKFLPGNFRISSSQENIPRLSNITQLIKSDNMSQEPNPSIIYDTNEINKSDNNIQYRNTSNDKLNSTTRNDITNEKIINDVSNEINKSKVNSEITLELPTQYLAEATTNNYPIYLNTSDVMVTFLNEGRNKTNILEKLSVTDDIMIPTSIISGANETSMKFTNSVLHYGVSNIALTSNKLQPLNLTNELEQYLTVIKDLNNNNNITTTEPSNNITTEISNGVTMLKPLSEFISNNETWPKPIMVTVNTDLYSKNTITAEPSNNITTEISNGVTISKPLSDLISRNETWLKPFIVTVATDVDNNNTTTTETSNNITAKISNGVTILKPLSDLISKNETWPKPIMMTVTTDLENNNTTNTEPSNNIIAEISNGVTILKPLSDLISKNETWPKPIMMTVATDVDNNNTTTTEPSNNITAEISNGVTILKPLSDLISKNETWPKPIMMTVATDVDNNNKTTTEPSNNITAEISNGVTILKPLSDLISKNETWPKPIMVTVNTDLYSKNTITAEPSNNITTEISNGVTISKPLSDLISRNETWLKPFIVTVATDVDNNNTTTTETSNNITAKISNGVTILKPLSDLISKNETWPKPIMMTVTTDLENNNTTNTEPSNNIIAEISNGVTILKPLSDLISKNETWPKPIMMTVATDVDNNNTTTTEPSNNITAEISNGVTILKPLSDLISKNETWPKPIMMTVATDVDNNNKTTTEPSNNITAEISNGVTILKPLSDLISKNETWPKPIMMTVATDVDNNNTTTTEPSNNITAEISNGVTILKPLSDLISKNETWPKPIMMTVATDVDNNNTTTTEPSNNITAEISNGVTILKPLSDLISKNETWPKPIMMTVATDVDNNNTTTTEPSNNITAEISNGVTILKPLSDLISKNETWPKPIMMTVATDVDNNNTTTTEPSNNITAEISYGVTILKPLSDLISKNETWPKPIMMTVATDVDNNNTTTTEPSNNITAEISNGVTILKPLSDLISKNETWPKPIMMTVATDVDNNNTTTTEPSNNITAEISNGVTILKPLSDLISKNETWPKPIMMTVATDVDNNNTTTTEPSNNITAEISYGVTILKPLSDLISKNETWPKPIMMTVATDVYNNNTTTTEPSNNITAEISNRVTILKPLSDLISKNETWPKPIMMTVATDVDNNNTTTTEPSNNITAEISYGVTILKPLSDLISKNETWPKPIMMTVATDVDNNNTTATEPSNNITAEISYGVTILKPLLDLISKNETWPKPIMMTVATDVDNNNTTTTEPSNNITVEISNGVTILKPLSDLISKNETWPKPIMMTVATDVDNNNTTTTEPSNNITAEMSNGVTILKPLSNSKNEMVVVIGITDFDNNNTTTTEPSNNITAKISNEVPTTSTIQPTDFKYLMVTNTLDSVYKDNSFVTTSAIFTDNQSLNEATTSLSSLTKIPDYIFMRKKIDSNSIGLISSINSVTSYLKQNTISNTTSLASILDKPTTFLGRNSEILDKNTTNYDSYITKPVNNSINEINNSFSSNSTIINKISDVYETKTESDTASITIKSLTGTAALESANSRALTKNTFAVIDELAQYRGVSSNIKSIEDTSKLESLITATPSTYFVSNTISKQVNSSETKTVTIQSSISNKKELNKIRVIGKNTSNNNEILSNNSDKNLNLTNLSTKHIIPKLVTSNNFSVSPALNITNLNNNKTNINSNLTDNSNKNDFHLGVNPLTVNVTNTDFNHTYTNKASSVSRYAKSIPNSLTKPFLNEIYKVSPRNLGENVLLTRTFNKSTPSNKQNEAEDKESSLIQQHGNAPVYAIRNIKHEGNKTVQLLNPYNEATTPAIEVNDIARTLIEITYNISEPSTVRNNVNDFLMENKTMTSSDKNTTKKDFYNKEVSGFNKSNSTTNTLVNNYKNRSELADYFPLSEISNKPHSGYVKRPLLIIQKPLEKVNKSSLHKDNENLVLVTEHRLQGHVSDRINKSKISEISNVNRTEHSAPVKNITSSDWGVVDKMVVAKPTKTFTYDRNVSQVKSLSVLRIKDNYAHNLHATSESSLTTNNLLRNTSSQTYSNNKTHHVMSSNAVVLSRTLADHNKSSQIAEPSNTIKMETTLLPLKIPKLEIISKQDKISISEPPRFINTNRSNGVEEKQLRPGLMENGYLESTTVGNGVTKNIGIHTKNYFTTTINSVYNSETKCENMPPKQEFTCTNRGKYSDKNDCNKFYVCIGRVKPLIGVCPTGTVFSEYLKQCTKHITHCIRNNQFKCTRAGRFINILSNNTYFICARNKSSFIRYRLQCQKGYYLDKYNIKCAPEIINISISDENSSKKTKELSFHKELEGISVNSKLVFECEKEGKFKDPQDCRKYYICKKGRKSTFRLKIKQCDSDEVFHGKKKKCVDVESYECGI